MTRPDYLQHMDTGAERYEDVTETDHMEVARRAGIHYEAEMAERGRQYEARLQRRDELHALCRAAGRDTDGHCRRCGAAHCEAHDTTHAQTLAAINARYEEAVRVG